MLNRTLSLGDLISTLEELREEYGEDILVVSTSDYGDYNHTEQMVEILDVGVANPVKSGYSHSGYAFEESNELDETKQKVIVLRGVV